MSDCAEDEDETDGWCTNCRAGDHGACLAGGCSCPGREINDW